MDHMQFLEENINRLILEKLNIEKFEQFKADIIDTYLTKTYL